MVDLFKLLCFNVRSISNFHQRRTVFTWCGKRKADIIFLQETHSKEDSVKKNEQMNGANVFVSVFFSPL